MSLFDCRVSSSEFIIPLNKFLKSLDQFYSVGMRFRMRFESEDAAERRFFLHVITALDCASVAKLYINFFLADARV